MNDGNYHDIHTIFMEIMRLHFLKGHQELDKVGIYSGQAALLMKLNKENGLSQKEIADRLTVKPATITVMLQRMEKTNYIIREKDDIDKRISRIFITDKGREVCDEIKKVHDKFEEECFVNLNEDEILILRTLLMRVRDNLRENLNISDESKVCHIPFFKKDEM